MDEQHKRSENRSEKPVSDLVPESTSSSKGEETSAEQSDVSVEVLEESDKTAVVSIRRASFIAPLPPPDMLRQYDEAVPGSAERIMNIAETSIAAFRDNRKIGQYGGIFIACFAVVGACLTAFFSDSWYVSLSAVLIVALGVGGPTVAQAFVERLPKRNGKNKD